MKQAGIILSTRAEPTDMPKWGNKTTCRRYDCIIVFCLGRICSFVGQVNERRILFPRV